MKANVVLTSYFAANYISVMTYSNSELKNLIIIRYYCDTDFEYMLYT
jgi:hypothetical protein